MFFVIKIKNKILKKLYHKITILCIFFKDAQASLRSKDFKNEILKILEHKITNFNRRKKTKENCVYFKLKTIYS